MVFKPGWQTNSNIDIKGYVYGITETTSGSTLSVAVGSAGIFDVSFARDTPNFTIKVLQDIKNCIVSAVMQNGGATPVYAFYKNGISISVADLNAITAFSTGDTIVGSVSGTGSGSKSLCGVFIIAK